MREFKTVPTLVTQRGGPHTMAKALLGHVGGPDPRMISEMRRLQQRVRDLEAELMRLQDENDALMGPPAPLGSPMFFRPHPRAGAHPAMLGRRWPGASGAIGRSGLPLFWCP